MAKIILGTTCAFSLIISLPSLVIYDIVTINITESSCLQVKTKTVFDMPTFVVYTNLPKQKIPEDFLNNASKFIAERLGKPESYVTVRVHPDQMMCHGGSSDPCASIILYSIGKLGEQNTDHAKNIGDFIEKHLNIPADRYYVTFCDLDRNDVALNRKTFKQ